MVFDDKREESLKGISLESSRVNYSHPIIFMCGGLVDVSEPEPPSVRAALVEYLHNVGCELAQGLTLAENYKDWIHDSVYKNLIEFETDIAQISSLIVLCLESAGSITELGLFVKSPELRKKLLVFVSDAHYQESSFISLGPLRYLESENEASVCAYPWDSSNLTRSLADSYNEMRGDMLSALARQNNSEKFNRDNHGHLAFLIYEIVKTFKAVKLTEVNKYLEVVGVSLKPDKLKRLLFILNKLQLIGRRRRGHTWYYYAVGDHRKISFGGRFDPLNAGLVAQQFYVTNEGEAPRLEVIKANLQAVAALEEVAV